jgi:uncharacterized membrane protein YuzA (DUF378 family)
VAKPLMIAGALNWGSIGLFRYDFIMAIFRNDMLLRVVDTAIGLAAIVFIACMFMKKKDMRK